MSLKVISEKLTGKAGSGGWSQVYEYKPEDPDELNKKGHIYIVVVGKKSEKEVEGIMEARSILQRIQNEYYYEDFGKPLGKLKSIVESIITSHPLNDLELGVLLYVGDIMYLVATGGTRIYLYRKTTYVPIIKSDSEKVVSASGKPEDEDMYLIGSNSFFKNFSGGILKASLQQRQVKELTEAFTPQVQALPGSGEVALLALKFIKDTSPLPSKVEEEAIKLPQTAPGNPLISQPIRGFIKNNLYVKNTEPETELAKRRKLTAFVGVFLLLILLVSIISGINHKKSQDLRKSYQEELISATHNLDEAENINSLNPSRSRQLFLEAKEKVLGLSTKNIEDPELAKLKDRIEKSEGRLMGEFSDKAEVFVNLELLSDGFDGTQMVFSGGDLFILDDEDRKLVKIEVASKRSEVIAGPNKIASSGPIAAYNGNVYLANNEGIFEVSEEKIQVLDKDWESPFLLTAYAGNLYLLEKNSSTITRYPGDGQKFGTGKPWLRDDLEIDLKNARSWVIDGNVWILTDDGEILRFSMGNKLNFRYDTSATEEFVPDGLFTDDSSEYLYILDRAGGSIKVFAKDGSYKSQYVSDDIKNSLGFAVSEKDKKILLLTGKHVLTMPLKHL